MNSDRAAYIKMFSQLPESARRKVIASMIMSGKNPTLLATAFNKLSKSVSKTNPKASKVFASNRDWIKKSITSKK